MITQCEPVRAHGTGILRGVPVTPDVEQQRFAIAKVQQALGR